MLNQFVEGTLFLIFGVCCVAFAQQLSDSERKLVEKFPRMRVTGWAGTRKGVLVLKWCGAIVIVSAILQEIVVLALLLYPH